MRQPLSNAWPRLLWHSALLLAGWLAMPVPALAQMPAAPQLRIEAGMHTAMINRIDTDAAGRWTVTASDDKTARVWDTASGRLLQVLRPPIGAGNEGKLYAVAMSPDGATVAMGGWNQLDAVYLFDRASGRLTGRLLGSGNVINHLAFSPDGRWLAAVLGAGQGVRVWEWRAGSGALSDAGYSGRANGAAWSADGRLATSSYDGNVRLYDLAGGRLNKHAQASAPGGKRPFALAFDPAGARLAVGYEDTTRVDVLDGRTLAPLYAPSVVGVGNGNLGRVAFSRDGRTLAAGGRWDTARRFPVRQWPDAGRGQPQDVPTAGDTLVHLAALPDGGFVIGASDPAWGVLGADGRWQPRGQPPQADLRGSRGDAFLLAAGGMQLQFGFEERGKPPHRFDLRQRQLQPGALAAGRAPDTSSLPVTDWVNELQPKLRGQPLKLQISETSRSLAIAPNAAGFVLGAEFRLRHYAPDGTLRWQQPIPGTNWGVNIPADGPRAGQLVVAAYGDGTIRWHRLSDGQELLAFFPHADRQRWVLWTPSGYYDASPGGEDLIGWHVNRGSDQAAEFFPASRFRSKFYRPDVIDRVLDTLNEAEALKQADVAANRRQDAPASVAQALPPMVELAGPSELSTASAQVSLRVRARTAADAAVTAWRVRVNGQLVSDSRGLGLPGAAAAPSPNERDLLVPLPPQDSEIQVFAENRHGPSTPATVRVKWTGNAPAAAAQPAAFNIKPKLYVLAVGVSDYQNPGVNKLRLAAKDASDFVAALQRQKGRLYRDVEVRLLQDQRAGKDDILEGMDWLQKSATQHDVAMMFVAGHGLNDGARGNTFLPVNGDPGRLFSTGVRLSDIRAVLGSMVAKTIFFFDSCHSGGVVQDRGEHARTLDQDVNVVINELSGAENGVTVFSSSSSRQVSFEDLAWGNGAFTKAVVEGLGGEAAYQPGDNRITLKMLDLYISERVKKLTNGRQTPVSRSPVADFPVALK